MSQKELIEMITIYWHCLGTTAPVEDEKFVAGALEELSGYLRTKLPQLTIKFKRLEDEPEVAKDVDTILNKVDNDILAP